MKIKTWEYELSYLEDESLLLCHGSFRFELTDIKPVADLVNAALQKSPNKLIVDMREVTVLNSAGINIFSRLAMDIRDKEGFYFLVKISPSIPWHKKLITNLIRLLPELSVEQG